MLKKLKKEYVKLWFLNGFFNLYSETIRSGLQDLTGFIINGYNLNNVLMAGFEMKTERTIR